jgi:hypothetical protein
MSASRKPPENNPFAAALRFHVEEAIANGARVAMLIWEGDKGIEVATVPQSKALAVGLISCSDDALFPDVETDSEED